MPVNYNDYLTQLRQDSPYATWKKSAEQFLQSDPNRYESIQREGSLGRIFDVVEGGARPRDVQLYTERYGSLIDQLKNLPGYQQAMSNRNLEMNVANKEMQLRKAFGKTPVESSMRFKPTVSFMGKEYENSDIGNYQRFNDYMKQNMSAEEFANWQQREARGQLPSLLEQKKSLEDQLAYSKNAAENYKGSNKSQAANFAAQQAGFNVQLNRINQKLKLLGVDPELEVQSEVGMQADSNRQVRQMKLDRRVREGKITGDRIDREQRLIDLQDQMHRTGTGREALLALSKERQDAGDFKLRMYPGYVPSNTPGQMGTYTQGRPGVRFGTPTQQQISDITAQANGQAGQYTGTISSDNSSNMPTGGASTNPNNNVPTSNPITPAIQGILSGLPQGQSAGYTRLLNSGDPRIVRNTIANLNAIARGRSGSQNVGGTTSGGSGGNTGGSMGVPSGGTPGGTSGGASGGTSSGTSSGTSGITPSGSTGTHTPGVGTGIYTGVPGQEGNYNTNVHETRDPNFQTEQYRNLYETIKDRYETSSKNYGDRMRDLLRSRGEFTEDQVNQAEATFSDIINSRLADMDELRRTARDTERVFERTRSGELATASEVREQKERNLALERKESMDTFNSSIREQRQSVIRERLRNETFAGLKGNFAGSGAALENLGRAEMLGRSVLASLQTAKARSGEKFANVYNDIQDNYVQSLRSINSTADEKIANLKMSVQQQLQAIKENNYQTKEQKFKAIQDLKQNYYDQEGAIGMAVAQSAFNTALKVGELGVQQVNAEMDYLLEQQKMALEERKFAASRASQDGGGNEWSDILNADYSSGDTMTGEMGDVESQSQANISEYRASQKGKPFKYDATQEDLKRRGMEAITRFRFGEAAKIQKEFKNYTKQKEAVDAFFASSAKAKAERNLPPEIKKSKALNDRLDQYARDIANKLMLQSGKGKDDVVKWNDSTVNDSIPKGTPLALRQEIERRIMSLIQ